jgi:integrase
MPAPSPASDSTGSRPEQEDVRYLVLMRGKWRYLPTAPMKQRGFKFLTLTRDATLTEAAKAKARALNAEWDAARLGTEERSRYPAGSVGHGYLRAMAMRDQARKDKGLPPLTPEQIARDDWRRTWRWIEPAFGDVDPKTVSPEDLQRLRGIVQQKVSLTEAHRVIKIWRALWKKLESFGYCSDKNGIRKDPSLAFANNTPDPRQAIWRHHEVLRLVRWFWRNGYRGLAAAVAVAWDSGLSPIDVRKLTLGQLDVEHALFRLGRAKTGRAAAATLSPWSTALLIAYVKGLGVELHPDTPIFRTRGWCIETRAADSVSAMILNALMQANGPVSRARLVALGEEHGFTAHDVDQALHWMCKAGRIERPEYGHYAIAEQEVPLGPNQCVVAERSVPYTKNTMAKDFRAGRAALFGKDDDRKISDLRRSGAVEADAGGVSVEDLSNKLANTISASNRLRKTYNPVNIPAVRRVDQARLLGRERLK